MFLWTERVREEQKECGKSQRFCAASSEEESGRRRSARGRQRSGAGTRSIPRGRRFASPALLFPAFRPTGSSARQPFSGRDALLVTGLLNSPFLPFARAVERDAEVAPAKVFGIRSEYTKHSAAAYGIWILLVGWQRARCWDNFPLIPARECMTGHLYGARERRKFLFRPGRELASAVCISLCCFANAINLHHPL